MLLFYCHVYNIEPSHSRACVSQRGERSGIVK